MTQISNAKQSNRAFGKFFLFFILAVIAIVAAAFFNFQMPRAENKLLKNKLETYEATGSATQNFKETLTRVKNMIDSLDKQGSSTDLYDREITTKLANLKAMSASDELNKTIADGLDQYRFYKKKSMSLDKGESEMQKCQDKLETANDKIRALELKITRCGCTD